MGLACLANSMFKRNYFCFEMKLACLIFKNTYFIFVKKKIKFFASIFIFLISVYEFQFILIAISFLFFLNELKKNSIKNAKLIYLF